MTSDHDAFLRTICEHPFDLRPRLVYADWLDENDDEVTCETCDGTGEVQHYHSPRCWTCDGSGRVSNGFSARAEFIRLSCEYPVDGPLGDDVAKRLTFLWFKYRFFGKIDTRWTRHGFERADGPAGLIGGGFVQEIRCRLAWWIGGRCQCEGVLSFVPCRHCRGSGLIPANGPTVVSRQPVVRVEISDREPHQRPNGSWLWFGASIPHPPAELPREFFRLPTLLTVFSSREAAVGALSRALIDWARWRAGLTSILWTFTSSKESA